MPRQILLSQQFTGFLQGLGQHLAIILPVLLKLAWARDGGGFSLSAGKGFAPYGTDDPMSRRMVKFPANHHLSQLLERWVAAAAVSSTV